MYGEIVKQGEFIAVLSSAAWQEDISVNGSANTWLQTFLISALNVVEKSGFCHLKCPRYILQIGACENPDLTL
jgi:hypothetical protein